MKTARRTYHRIDAEDCPIMRITRLQVEDANQQPLVESTAASPGLNVIPLKPETRGDALTGLIHQVLYGDSGRWRETGRSCDAYGAVEVDDSLGRFRLRRTPQAGGSQRLTIANLDTRQVPSNAIDRLLQDLPVGVAEKVFHANGRRGDQLAELLSESVAEAFQQLDRRRPMNGRTTNETVTHEYAPQSHLLDRRDELARAIEDSLAEQRTRSSEIDREVREIEADSQRLITRRETVDRRRITLEAELSAIETRLRYEAISEAVNRETDSRDLSSMTPQLDELEEQIERWRATLAELELRESHVRSELATIHPDDASPTIALTDQRAGLTVAGRLLEDLEGEVARLARAADSNACVCRDAHPRINPLVETLAQQVARLADLAEQQELAFQAQHLKAEAEHLTRSQADLQRQLDHLLTRRQELWRTTRAKRDESVAVQESTVVTRPRADLENELADVTAELSEINASLDRLEAKRRDLLERRSGLLSSTHLESLRRELDELQHQINHRPADHYRQSNTVDRENPWRASELFARLTDGEWINLRLVQDGRELAATDRYGRQAPARELPSAERRLAALALRLSMAWTAAERAAVLPLVLDDPFAGLDAKQCSTLATVLEDFGRSGRQLFVSTADSTALHRFQSLGVHTLSQEDLVGRSRDADRRYVVEDIVRNVTPEPTQSVTRTVRTETTARSEYLLSPEDPIERFPVPIRNRQDVFARSRIRTISDLLGGDPSAVAEELDRDDVTAELVSLWQTHLALVCFVPHATFDDAIILTESGYLSPEDLADADEQQLYDRVNRYLSSDRGARHTSRAGGWDRGSAGRWIGYARQGRERWSNTDAWSGWQRRRGERRQRVERNQSRSTRNGRRTEGEARLRIRRESTDETRRSGGKKARKAKTLKFYLETTSPIVDAPSIGPKTAVKLERLGIRTVQDLVDCDPEVIAEQIESNRIDTETLVAWQHQAQLVCRIPELRGHDAQILVECGFTRPEEIASMKPAELFGFVEPFCSTSEAQRIIRNGKAPDLAEVSNWISWSRQCRVLGAA